MRPMHRTRSLNVAFFVVSLTIAASLAAQTASWKPFGSAAEGFRAQFPSEPELSKSNIPVGGNNFELRSYIAQVGSTALYVGVCDYGAKGLAADPKELLNSAKKGAVEHMSAHVVSEKKIDPGQGITSPGIAFEAESDRLHFTVRMYLAGGMLYQAMVVTALNENFADSARFLDSFELISRSPAGPQPQ